MDFHSLISSGLDQPLRCTVCKNYLSYFPISLCSNNQSLCGRCVVPEGLISYPDEAFETICQFHKFPCRYQSDGCPEELAPKDVPEHEKNCLFRLVRCVIRKPIKCEWKGLLPSLLPHCRSEHSDLLLKNDDGEYQLDLSNLADNECDQWVVHNDVMLIFTIRFDPTTDIFSCAFYNHEYAVNPETCSAQLSIKNGNKTLLLDLKATSFTEKIFSELSLQSIRSEGKQDSFLCQINIGNTQIKDHELERARSNAAILSVLKCSICSEFALPPIYRCVNNVHIVCSDCMDKQKEPRSCKLCPKNGVYELCDTTLDEISLLVKLKYPCKYQKNGCKYSLRCSQIKLHHNVCEYGTDKCPFARSETCVWKGLKRDVDDHVLKNHQELLVNSSDVLELAQNDKNINYKLIQFANRLFRLVYCMDRTSFMWSVQTIGFCKRKFKYEIDIVDGGTGGKRMLTREYCDKLTRMKDAGFSYFEGDQIRDFLIMKDKVRVAKFRVNMFR